MTPHTAFNSQGRKISRASGLQRREQIILATRRLIIRKGIRSVRHRAVAAEAEVPLAATSYYFKNLDELIFETFRFWANAFTQNSLAFREKCFSALAKYSAKDRQSKQRQAALAEVLSTLTANYIIEQLSENFDDYILGQAFYQEANTNTKLREVLCSLEESFLNNIIVLIDMMGSSQPQIDAQITLGLIRRMEQLSLLRGPGCYDAHEIRQVIHRHVFQLLKP